MALYAARPSAVQDFAGIASTLNCTQKPTWGTGICVCMLPSTSHCLPRFVLDLLYPLASLQGQPHTAGISSV